MSWERLKAEIEAVPALTLEEERNLARAYREGHAGAKKELIAANIRHALPIALALSKHGHRWEPGDLIGEAVRAMDAAVDRWDGRVPFGAYVKARLRGAMKDFLRRRADLMRTPTGTPEVLSLHFGEEREGDDGTMIDTDLKLAAGFADQDDEPAPLPDLLSPQEKRVMAATVLRQPTPGNVREACQSLNLTEETVRRTLRRALRKCAATGEV